MNSRREFRLWAVLALVGSFVVCASFAKAAVPATEATSSAGANSFDSVPQEEPLPDEVTTILHTSGGAQQLSSPLAGPGATDKEIYRNNRGQSIFRPGLNIAGLPMADDCLTTALVTCNATRFRVGVTGGVAGGGGTFNVNVRMYDGCPGSGGSPIEAPGPGQCSGNALVCQDDSDCIGTQTCIRNVMNKTFLNLSDDLSTVHVLEFDFLDPNSPSNGQPVPIPSEVWIRVQFSTQNAGWIFGAPADVGFSSNIYWNSQVNSCNAILDVASFYVQIFAESTCETSFLAYQSVDIEAQSVAFGANLRFADDLDLALAPASFCELATYEIGFIGVGGPFNVEVDLRSLGLGIPLPGTATTFTGLGTGKPEIFQFVAPTGIFLPDPVYITWKPDATGVGAMLPQRVQAGANLPSFFSIDPNNENLWNNLILTGNRVPIFYAKITCKGDAPTGACCPEQDPMLADIACTVPADCPLGRTCDPISCDLDADCPMGTCLAGNTCSVSMCSDVVCLDDLPVLGCVDSEGRWVASQTCASDPFTPSCGTHACCTPPGAKLCNLSRDIVCVDNLDCPLGEFCGTVASCEDLTNDQCLSLTDSTSSVLSCAFDEDCPGPRTCQGNGMCAPRAGVWGTGEFCGVAPFACPIYDCFFGQTDCFEPQNEVVCANDTAIDCTGVPCTNDVICSNFGQTCDTTVGWCTTDECFGRACVASIANPTSGLCRVPYPDDSMCPVGQACLPFPQLVCDQPRGCNNVSCCNTICNPNVDSFCCEVAWDSSCVAKALTLCNIGPANDSCFGKRCSESGFACIDDLSCIFAGETCDLSPVVVPVDIDLTTGFASVPADNTTATTSNSDPGICCSKSGPTFQGDGTLWYTFTMPSGMGASARIHTCNTAGGLIAIDSVIQIFESDIGACSVTTSTQCKIDQDCPMGETCDVTLETQCNNLSVVGCNDDFAGCSSSATNSDICAQGLVAGQQYFIVVASANPDTQGPYELTIEVPCPRLLPVNNDCDTAQGLPILPNPPPTAFDLATATLDCPGEPCVSAMTNDVWFDYSAACTGNLTIETCGVPSGMNNPDTTLAVYHAPDPFNACPPAILLGCNDDAPVNAAEHVNRSQTCSGGMRCVLDPVTGTGGSKTACVTSATCPVGETCADECDTDADCGLECKIAGGACSALADCAACTNTGVGCTSNSDCKSCTNNQSMVCQVDADCPAGGQCFVLGTCPIDPSEQCAAQICQGSCGSASTATVPVFSGQTYKIRLGGELGSEPTGSLSLSCVQDDCQPNGTPDAIDIATGVSFDVSPMNGIPDECEGCNILSTNPPNCEVDAGQPHPISAPGTPEGWTSMDFTFDNMCPSTPSVSDFSIRTVPGTTPPPGISSVSNLGATATVNFSGVIPTNEWTCVTYVPNMDEKCIGFLPGDVNKSLGTNAQDITALINALNGVTPRPNFATDVNRSGPPPNPQDITALINLLNGAGMFTIWNGEVISSQCPS